jgi:signal transduction histidine kinase
MRRLFRGRFGALAVFLLVAGLVAGGLGWVTVAALGLEREQLQGRADAEHAQKLHLALWRLDGRVAPALTLEDNRPYNHYSAVFAPSTALRNDGTAWDHGAVIEPSPLLHAELPDWMLVHFQADEESGWESPQVPYGALRRFLTNPRARVPRCNDTDARRRLLDELEKAVPAGTLLAAVKERGAAPTVHDIALVPVARPWDNNLFNNSDAQQPAMQQGVQSNSVYAPNSGGRAEANRRFETQNQAKNEVNPPNYKDDPAVAWNTLSRSGAGWFFCVPQRADHSAAVDVNVSPLMPLWLDGEGGEPRLLLVRLVRLEDKEFSKEVCQGVALDWPKLRSLLREQVADVFPEADLRPVRPGEAADPERTMSALPVQLVTPDAPPPADPAWAPLRIGLALAWAAALVALLAVGLGGWSLLDLSERRIRFVSAVTHELRTPLTTLRLYLDMLTGGLVKDEAQKEEYLHTLNAEADRLNRLVGNVLDFSRLENQTPRLNRTTVTLAALLEGVRETWQGRCEGAGKELVVEATVPPETLVDTDVALAQQVLGTLLDNACKYSKGAADRRLWLRAAGDGGRLVIEVEDRGPGVAACERRSIFRPFRRGKGADVTAGGVGLGLALAERWATLLGGRLTLRGGPEGAGACFRLELPL